MTINITVPNTSSDSLTFGSANTPTAAQVIGIDSGSSNGQLAFNTTASGTSTEAMRINASQNVGIGTTSPSTRLTIGRVDSSNEGGQIDLCRSSDNTSAWAIDVFGNTSTPSLRFVDNTAAAERARIDSSGNLLVGTTSTYTNTARFNAVQSTASNTAAAIATNYASDSGQAALYIGKYDNVSTTGQLFVRFTINNTGSGSGQINANGAGAAAFGSYSDERLKENIVDLPSQLSNIMALRPVEFDYIESEGGGHQTGFIAQNVQTVYPDSVGERSDGMLTVTGWSKTEARLVKAIQEQQAIINAQQAALESLTNRITALENK